MRKRCELARISLSVKKPNDIALRYC
jgi:hypothetical protein